MVKEFEDAKHINGVSYETSFEDAGKRIIVNKQQDATEILDHNKFQRDNFQGSQGKDMVKAASIPNIIVEKLMREGIWQDKARLKAWLNDPDNRAFRTSTGKV